MTKKVPFIHAGALPEFSSGAVVVETSWPSTAAWVSILEGANAQMQDVQEAVERAAESLGHRVTSIYDPQRGVLKLFLDPPEWMSPASLERADDDYRARRG